MVQRLEISRHCFLWGFSRVATDLQLLAEDLLRSRWSEVLVRAIRSSGLYGNAHRSTSPIATEWCGGDINRIGCRSIIGPAVLCSIHVMKNPLSTYKEYVMYSAPRNCYYHAVRGQSHADDSLGNVRGLAFDFAVSASLGRYAMRAGLTFRALADESSRYQLTKSAAKVTRMLHRSNTRVQDTMNRGLQWLGRFKPGAAKARMTRKDFSVRPRAPRHNPALD
jgi:hypothetical protein